MESSSAWESFQKMLPHKIIKRRIRKAAIRRVRRDLILHGKQESEVSKDDLEYLVADSEKKLIGELQKTGLIGILALLGLSHI